MVALPETLTVEFIYNHYEDQPRERRTYLGGSRIGEECRRMLWMEWRWVGRPSFPGRILRLFETGQREEDRIIANLRSIGVEVAGEQHEIVACNGHLKGHFDGVILNLPEARQTWHLLECKTMNKRNFDILLRQGVGKAKPVYYAQMQIYMGEAGLTRAAFFVQCKDDDRLYLERVKYDQKAHKDLLRKAESIFAAESPPDRISNDPSFYQCKFCDYSEHCHEPNFTGLRLYPEVNCRTCVHSSPADNGEWICGRDLKMTDDCDEHLYLPSMLHWLDPIDGDETWIEYKGFCNVTATGFPTKDKDCHTSRELRAKSIPG